MSNKKPSNEEEEYFAREEAEQRHKLAVETQRALEAAERERIQKLHHMKCPKCGFDLESVKFRAITIEKCFHCNGSWLDAGELEALAGSDDRLLDKIVAVFKR
jgi:hypothetical protein